MTTALLFDHDGVLVDTERLYYRATREVLATVGVDLTLELYRDLFLIAGKGAWHLAEQRGVSGAHIASLKARRSERYTELLLGERLVLPSTLAMLEALARDYRMAIVTSSHRAHFEAIHRDSGLPAYFELVLAREDYEKAKPDPEPYLRAASALEQSFDDYLVIEDSERGLTAAKAAGLRCWVVPSELTKGSSFVAADRTFSSLEQLVQALNESRLAGD